jgi:hypothetical protein
MEKIRQNTELAIERAAARGTICHMPLPEPCFTGEPVRMTLRMIVRSSTRTKLSMQLCSLFTAILLGACTCTLSAQDAAAPLPQAPAYTPKFSGDPARSDSEAAALAYMRVVIRAQRQFNKQYSHFATTLAELVHSGSFTKRMVNTDRGDYSASFKGKKDSYVLTMTPKNLDAQHRSFYAEDDGKIHAEETKAADGDSPILK